MYINRILKEKGMSQYRLSQESGIPKATVADICSGKAKIRKCAAETIYKIAKVLDVSMETIIEEDIKDEEQAKEPYRTSFEVFKSNVCHMVKDMGDIDFLIYMLENDIVRKVYNRKWYPEALYMLAMVDYLSKENDVELYGGYNDIRCQKFSEPIYPASAVLLDKIIKGSKYKESALKGALPEFLKYNIVEGEIRNVY